MNQRWALLLVLAIGAAPIHAEPSDAVRYLFNEPLTMMDWGMYRLEQTLDSVEVLNPLTNASEGTAALVNYAWDANRIVVSLTAWPKKVNAESARTMCKALIGDARSRLGVDPETGKPIFGEWTWVARVFQPYAFAKKTQPANLGDEMNAIIEIRVEINSPLMPTPGSTLLPGSHHAKCQGPLLSKDVLFAG